MAALQDTDPAVRRAALGAVFRLGVGRVDHLLAALDDPDPQVVRRAVELAARLGPHRDETGDPVDDGLDGPDGDGPEGPDGDLSERTTLAHRLVDLLNGPAAEVAAFALGELEVADARVVDALAAQVTEHDDALCRESAVAALGAIGQRLDVVLAALGDVAAVRRRAVIALAAFEGPDARAALERAVDDRDWQVRQVAEDLLGIDLDAEEAALDNGSGDGNGGAVGDSDNAGGA
ncbi:MAG: hypothetical protein AAGD35_18165 [Actinomycetota bacterium]